MVALTAAQLNRATLDRQMLLRRRQIPAVDAVRALVGLQAQEPASPYLALWNRVHRFDPAEVDQALRNGTLVKASLMRITLHLVAADDYTTFHEAMLGTLRASRLYDKRFAATGLTPEEADAILPALIEYAEEPRTPNEVKAMLASHPGESPEWLWWAFRTFAPLTRVPTETTWGFGREKAFRVGPTTPERVDRDEAIAVVLARYLTAFGPASVEDFTQFALVPRGIVREIVATLRDQLVQHEGPDGRPLLDLSGGSVPSPDVPAPPRLLPMWDSILLAYHDRSRVIPEEFRKRIIRRNGDTLPSILVDGLVAGVWRPVESGIEVTPFRSLSDDDWNGLEREARALVRFLADREPSAYSRYGRWWNDLEGLEPRVLAG